ncbi:MucBP domain-containing protein [Levilactobacillus zymae]|uniref:MucBP domain-containing protein n=1 Tax=Levilactobacillus zymae TaxID=267363 RepID=UPI003FCC4776
MRNAFTENKEHYKSYKAGKHWLYACLTVTTLGIGLLGGTASAQADTPDDATANQPATAEQVDPTTQPQPSATVPLKSTTPAKVVTTTPVAPESDSSAPEVKAPEAEVPAKTAPTADPTPAPVEKAPATNANAGEQEPATTPVVKSATPAPKAPAVSVEPSTSTEPNTLTTTPAVKAEANATIKPEVEAEVDPTTDPNNAVNWMPDPVMRQWVENTLTYANHFLSHGDPFEDVVATDENLYQMTGQKFILSQNLQSQPNLKNLQGLERFTNLEGFYVADTGLQLDGMINFDFAPNLTTFRVGSSNANNLGWNTSLNDFLKDYLAQNTKLTSLTLSNAGLSGDLTDLLNYPDLGMITLPHNQLTGSLPDLASLKDLFSLQVNDNQLSGNLPDVSKWTQLNTLDISNNNFTGDLPDVSGITSNLSYYQNHLSSGAYSPNDSPYTEGWYQSVTGKTFTQGQAQAGFDPFTDVINGVRDVTTGQTDFSLTTSPLYTHNIVYSRTSPQADATGHKPYVESTDWTIWAYQQTDASPWFTTTADPTNPIGYRLTATKSLPAGFYTMYVTPTRGSDVSDYNAVLTFQVDPAATSTITVKNVDQQGNLLGQHVLTGKEGNRVTVTADNLTNYKLLSTAATINKVYTLDPQTVVFEYASTLGTVTVKDVAPDGTVLAQRTLTGTIDDAFTANAGTHYGYTLVGEPTVNGTYTADPQTITFNYTNTKGTVTIKNVDTDGNLLSQKDLTGNVGDAFTANAEKLYGYTLTGDPTATGTYTEDPQTVTFVYTIAKGTVTVKNVDTDGNLISQKTLTGNVGADFTANAEKVYGYTVTGDSTATGTYTEEPQTVTFVYAIAKGTVNVKNVDTDGNLLSQTVLTGNVGDTFTANAEKLYGYTLTGDPTATGTYAEEPQAITFIYAIAKGTVTVKNVDTDGNLLSQKTLTGNVGNTFTTNADKLYGYTVTGALVATGTYAEDAQTVTFVYDHAQGTVTVQNVDQDGTVLSQHTLTGNVGDAFTANAETPAGYRVTGPTSQTGTYTAAPQTLTFTFEPLPVAQGTVTVQNVDTAGNVLSQRTLTGKVGDTFTANAETPAGYQVTGPATQTGTYTAAPQTITFTFAKITTGGGGDIDVPATNGTIIVQNVDANGTILSQRTLTGKVGDTVTVTAEPLTGYQITGPTTQTGTYADQPQTLTFTFEKVVPNTNDNGSDGDQAAVKPTTPTQPTKPGTPLTPITGEQPATAHPGTGDQNDQATRSTNRETETTPTVMTNGAAAKVTALTPATPVASVHQATNVSATKLPQTNDQASVNPLIAGLTLLLATLGLGLNRKRNH